jgi:O-methyltransferase involved in polyketide biosynthesis
LETQKIKLTQEKETLLIPLYSKAMESQRPHPILVDEKAQEILGCIDYDFSGLKIPKQSRVTLSMRAKKLDGYVMDYLKEIRSPLVIHLGCGLDSRVVRTGGAKAEWYDLDFPEVIELRKKFYEETGHYHMIARSVTDLAWMDQVKEPGPACIIAEGLLMYLREAEVKSLVLALQKRFPGSQMAFDAYSLLTARNARNHPSIKKTGAEIHWGIDDAKGLESWGPGINLKEEWYFSDSEDVADLDFGFKLLFKAAAAFPAARRAHRILYLQL